MCFSRGFGLNGRVVTESYVTPFWCCSYFSAVLLFSAVQSTGAASALRLQNIKSSRALYFLLNFFSFSPTFSVSLSTSCLSFFLSFSLSRLLPSSHLLLHYHQLIHGCRRLPLKRDDRVRFTSLSMTMPLCVGLISSLISIFNVFISNMKMRSCIGSWMTQLDGPAVTSAGGDLQRGDALRVDSGVSFPRLVGRLWFTPASLAGSYHSVLPLSPTRSLTHSLPLLFFSLPLWLTLLIVRSLVIHSARVIHCRTHSLTRSLTTQEMRLFCFFTVRENENALWNLEGQLFFYYSWLWSHPRSDLCTY